jgi:hypothetical protein
VQPNQGSLADVIVASAAVAVLLLPLLLCCCADHQPSAGQGNIPSPTTCKQSIKQINPCRRYHSRT